MKDLTRICAADVANVGNDISRLRGFVDSSYAQFALLGVQLMWTTDVQSALEQASTTAFKPVSVASPAQVQAARMQRLIPKKHCVCRMFDMRDQGSCIEECYAVLSRWC